MTWTAGLQLLGGAFYTSGVGNKRRFSEQINSMIMTNRGNKVESGCAPTVGASTDLTASANHLNIASGNVLVAGVQLTFAGGNIDLNGAFAALSAGALETRYVLITIFNSTGTATLRATNGTRAVDGNQEAPEDPEDEVVIALIYLNEADSTFDLNQIGDWRQFTPDGELYRDNAKSYWGRKIIILSRDASLARAVGCEGSASQYRCVRVTSPYEAAAELLSEPPLAMVVDLRCLTPGDLPLIEMARQRGLEVLAVGSVPLGITTVDLSGVRLSSRDHLSVLLETFSKSPPSVGRVPVSSQAVPGESPELSSLARSIRKASRTAPKAADAPAPTADNKPPIDSPDDLLTRAELAALPEDES